MSPKRLKKYFIIPIRNLTCITTINPLERIIPRASSPNYKMKSNDRIPVILRVFFGRAFICETYEQYSAKRAEKINRSLNMETTGS